MEAEVIDESSDPFGFSVRVRLTSPTGVSDGEEEMSSNEVGIHWCHLVVSCKCPVHA